ncbi:MAG: hypothetical protein J7483_06855 [Novosphingobium sp.]|nr:hypothetical protein [Novosphingobium sp.]
MLKTILTAAAIAAPMLWAAPAMAQSNDGILVVYGNDKCPTNTDGEEIVVCRRLDESERFRIPKDLRATAIAPRNESWATRSRDALTVGGTGTGSCSAVGAGGFTGCFVQQARAAKAERKQRNNEADFLPLP